jgi:hypothetical protein
VGQSLSIWLWWREVFHVIRVPGSHLRRGFDLMSSRLGVWRSDQLLASLSLDRLLYIAPSSTVLVLHLGIERYCLSWCWASKSASDCQAVCIIAQPQPDRLCATCPALITQGHQYRRLNPIGFLCYQSAGFLSTQGI